MRRASRVAGAICVVLVAVQTQSARAQSAGSPFAACTAAGPAWTYDELLCFYRVGSRHGQLARARVLLRRLGAGDVGHPWPTLVLGHTTLGDDELGALREYETAAEGFARAGEADGEVIARQNLRNLYRRRGDVTAASLQVDLAHAAAERSGAPLTVARASVIEAGQLLETGGDVGRAHRALLRARELAFPAGPIGLRRAILFNLANTSLYLGRFDDARDALEGHRALRAEDGSTVDAAAVAFNMLNLRLTQAESRPSPSERDRLIRLAEETLLEVRATGGRSSEAQTHRVLGDLLRAIDPEGAAMHLDRCLGIESALGHPEMRARCLWALSLHEASRNPLHAEALSREALALASAHPGGPLLAFAWQARLRLVWRVLPEDRAMADSLEALEAMERLRSGQAGDTSRAELFGNWTRDYYWLAGRLLDARPPQTDLAFDVGERLRARVLLEQLARAGIHHREEPQRAARRKDVERRIADTQRRLLSDVTSQDDRQALLDRLRLLELERADLGDGEAAVAASALPGASLEAVRGALDDREAMLWFSIAPWRDLYGDFGGGAWVLVVTRRAVRAHRLETDAGLDSRIAALIGLLRQRDARAASWEPGAHSLGRMLLGGALGDLPDAIERLVIVSDGALHRLPFEALRPDRRAPALGERFDISVVPSATLWLRLRRARTSPSNGSALVLADPDVPRGGGIGGERLEPLPWARREAASIAGALGLDARSVHQGSAASEHRVKTAPFGRHPVLHLAAHARVDAAFPDRSAVFLTPGAADDDGWLQPREIAALDLKGALVVLSACESADGALLSGEGPLSLARAFFAGGAGGVLATRWPLRDDDAAFVMARFYRALGAGHGLAASLRRARRDAIEAGLPAAAWAGVALLGDGSRNPIRPRTATGGWPWLVVIAVAMAAGIEWIDASRRRGTKQALREFHGLGRS